MSCDFTSFSIAFHLYQDDARMHALKYIYTEYFNILNIFSIYFNGSNTDDSYTTAVSNSFLNPLEKST